MSPVEEVLSMGEFVLRTLESWVFAVLGLSTMVYIIKLHFSNGDYKHFRLAQLVMRKDGTLDRKACYTLALFGASLYGCVYVLHHVHEMIVTYFSLQATIWLGKHVLDDKLPNRGVPTLDHEEHPEHPGGAP